MYMVYSMRVHLVILLHGDPCSSEQVTADHCRNTLYNMNERDAAR